MNFVQLILFLDKNRRKTEMARIRHLRQEGRYYVSIAVIRHIESAAWRTCLLLSVPAPNCLVLFTSPCPSKTRHWDPRNSTLSPNFVIPGAACVLPHLRFRRISWVPCQTFPRQFTRVVGAGVCGGRGIPCKVTDKICVLFLSNDHVQLPENVYFLVHWSFCQRKRCCYKSHKYFLSSWILSNQKPKKCNPSLPNAY